MIQSKRRRKIAASIPGNRAGLPRAPRSARLSTPHSDPLRDGFVWRQGEQIFVRATAPTLSSVVEWLSWFDFNTLDWLDFNPLGDCVHTCQVSGTFTNGEGDVCYGGVSADDKAALISQPDVRRAG